MTQAARVCECLLHRLLLLLRLTLEIARMLLLLQLLQTAEQVVLLLLAVAPCSGLRAAKAGAYVRAVRGHKRPGEQQGG